MFRHIKQSLTITEAVRLCTDKLPQKLLTAVQQMAATKLLIKRWTTSHVPDLDQHPRPRSALQLQPIKVVGQSHPNTHCQGQGQDHIPNQGHKNPGAQRRGACCFISLSFSMNILVFVSVHLSFGNCFCNYGSTEGFVSFLLQVFDPFNCPILYTIHLLVMFYV